MRLLQLFLVLAVAASAAQSAPKTSYDRAMGPFVAELDRQCPGRRLQDLSAGDLELIMEGFEDHLTVTQRHKVEDAVGYQCARVEAGLTCGNTASLDAFRRLGVLPQFTAAACATRWTCKGFADCAETHP